MVHAPGRLGDCCATRGGMPRGRHTHPDPPEGESATGAGRTAYPSCEPDPKVTHMRTYTPKPGEVTRAWHVIDATDVVLGRLAVQTAVLLRGKHKPTFAPHVDTGDFVIIINAEKVALTGNKAQLKRAYRHSGFPGGLSSMTYAELLDKDPRRAIEKAVRGMLPKNSLARQQLAKLKVYTGDAHPHAAQQPVPFEITQVDQ